MGGCNTACRGDLIAEAGGGALAESLGEFCIGASAGECARGDNRLGIPFDGATTGIPSLFQIKLGGGVDMGETSGSDKLDGGTSGTKGCMGGEYLGKLLGGGDVAGTGKLDGGTLGGGCLNKLCGGDAAGT